MSEKRLVIIRGIPSSGKSTLAKEIYDEVIGHGKTAVICSADNFFMVEGENGWEYCYDPNKIGNAHMDCRRRASRAMTEGINVVIIDNTNVTAKEVFDYVEYAIISDYEIEFVEPQTPWWHAVKPFLHGKKNEARLKASAKVFAEKNTHGVPEHTIFKMLMRWEPDLTIEKVLEF